MERERDFLENLSTEELVERFLQIPPNSVFHKVDIPRDLDLIFEGHEEEMKIKCKLLKNGDLDTHSVDEELKERTEFLKRIFSDNQRQIDLIFLFDRGTLWVAHSLFLIKGNPEGLTNDLKVVQEKAARLFLQAAIAADAIEQRLSAQIIRGLLNSGFHKEAGRVAEKSSILILSEERGSSVKIDRLIGKKDPELNKEGLYEIDKHKLKNNRLN